MLRVEEAQELVLSEVGILAPESLPFFDALGRVLREDVVSPHDVPQADNSAMDGYAVRAADVPGELRVIEDVPAGRIATRRVEAGTAIRIMTGALLPEGADAVAQVEITDGGTAVVRVQQGVASGANVRRRGEDMRTGDVVLTAGTRLRAADIGVLAGVQKLNVQVGPRPRVAILSTGDELSEVDQPRTAGKVVNSNAYALVALAIEAGAIPRRLPIVRDDKQATIAAIESALDCDFIVSSGGVSVGAYDFVKDALDALGAQTKFWKVAMKPGKPVVLSRLRERVYFGLPGNPVSCMVAFHLFVAPALRKAMGQRADLFPPAVSARAMASMKGAGDRRAYVRVRVVARDGELLAFPMRAQGSGVSTSMVQANGLAVVDASIDDGASVQVLLIGEIFSSSPR